MWDNDAAMRLKLFTTHCPKCKVIEGKIEKAGLPVEICEDMDELRRVDPGAETVPRLLAQNEGEKPVMMDFAAAAAFLNAILKNKNS